MLRWCYILLIFEFCRFQARSIINESCNPKSPTVIPEHCILKCLQLLYDNKFCTICENGEKDIDSSVEETLVEKRKLKWCSACESDQWQINSTRYELYRHIANFFNDLEISWCNDALNLNEYNDMTELHRTKRYNPGIGGAHSYRPSHSRSPNADPSQAFFVMGMIILGIFLLCGLGFLCKKFANNLNSQESYQLNS